VFNDDCIEPFGFEFGPLGVNVVPREIDRAALQAYRERHFNYACLLGSNGGK
jgi:hypothetical protein